MTKYNLDKLIKVKVSDFYPAIWYEYRLEKKYFGFIFQKEGIYDDCIKYEYLGFKIPEGHILKDKVLYEKPEVLMTFVSGYKTVKIFDTLEEAKTFAEEITKGKNWLLN